MRHMTDNVCAQQLWRNRGKNLHGVLLAFSLHFNNKSWKLKPCYEIMNYENLYTSILVTASFAYYTPRNELRRV